MKTVYKQLTGLLLTGLLSAALVSTADAQRGFHGGGFRSGGGGSFRGGVSIGASRGFYSGPRVGVGIGLGYHSFGGFYHPRYAYPHIGLFIGALPYGYYPFWFGPYQYFYNDGVFYAPYNGGYQVTAPPVGAEVPKLPSQAQSIVIDGQQFYEFNGVYYREIVKQDGKHAYVVAGKDGVLNTDANGQVIDGATPAPGADGAAVNPDNAPQMPRVGDFTDQLPQGSRKVTLNGQKYWVTPEGIYLEEVKNGDKVSYKVISVPSDQDQNDNQDENNNQ